MIHAYAAKEKGHELALFEYDPGPLGPDEVEVNVEHCGICHSDLSMLKNEWGMTQYPFVGGHEVIGSIGQVGDSVNHLHPGQRVGLGWHAGYCSNCSPCIAGDHNLCTQAASTIVGRHGGFADKVRARANSLFLLPENLDPAKAGPLLCGGITVFNPLIEYNISPTSRVAVIGIGGLGHLALQFANAWGCHVTALTSTDAKREEALRMGAHATLNSRDSKELETAQGSFDLILSTVNVTLDWNACIATLAPKGRLHLLGATLEPISFSVFPLLLGQRSISSSPVGNPGSINHMLNFAARHKIAPVTEHFKFDQINEAFEHLESGKARYRIVLSHN